MTETFSQREIAAIDMSERCRAKDMGCQQDALEVYKSHEKPLAAPHQFQPIQFRQVEPQHLRIIA